jgi:outer membrane receptor protein involved in Fe transport
MPSAIVTDITVNPGYTVIGLGVDVELHKSLTAYLRLGNAGGEVYESALGYPGMPRTFVTGVRVRFGGR